MALSRDEILTLLANLDGAVPALLHQYPCEGDFNPAFAALADAITDSAGVANEIWVLAEIDTILERHGLWRPVQNDSSDETGHD